jgi:hypothetical protein
MNGSITCKVPTSAFKTIEPSTASAMSSHVEMLANCGEGAKVVSYAVLCIMLIHVTSVCNTHMDDGASVMRSVDCITGVNSSVQRMITL